MELMATSAHRFDFSKHNHDLKYIAINDPEVLDRHICDTLQKNRRRWGYGGWGEHRTFYESEGVSNQDIHLGLDIWLPADTPIYAPFTGTIHGYQDHADRKGSGPTIVTRHAIGETTFWILFANLSKNSLESVKVGKTVRSGDEIARVGAKHENGGWPAHVHLQIISDMTGHIDHFPQYAKQSEKEHYLRICPNPESLIAPFLT